MDTELKPTLGFTRSHSKNSLVQSDDDDEDTDGMGEDVRLLGRHSKSLGKLNRESNSPFYGSHRNINTPVIPEDDESGDEYDSFDTDENQTKISTFSCPSFCQ